MQIHELNKQPGKLKEQQISEVDLFGPQGVVSVGKQILKNPKALYKSSELGAAKQAAAQTSAANSAATLAQRGYRAGAGPQVSTSPMQQLQAVKQNPAVQQTVKNLAAAWRQQAKPLAASMKRASANTPTKPLPEAVHIANPAMVNDPAEQKILAALARQEAEKQSIQTAAPPSPEVQRELYQGLDNYAKQFQSWAATQLSNMGIKMSAIESDAAVRQELSNLLLKISAYGLGGASSADADAVVQEYFYLAIATAQSQSQKQGAAPGAKAGGTGATPANPQQQDMELLQQLGMTVRPDLLSSLGAAMSRAGDGNKVIRNTGNTALNALARLAGFQIGR